MKDKRTTNYRGNGDKTDVFRSLREYTFSSIYPEKVYGTVMNRIREKNTDTIEFLKVAKKNYRKRSQHFAPYKIIDNNSSYTINDNWYVFEYICDSKIQIDNGKLVDSQSIKVLKEHGFFDENKFIDLEIKSVIADNKVLETISIEDKFYFKSDRNINTVLIKLNSEDLQDSVQCNKYSPSKVYINSSKVEEINSNRIISEIPITSLTDFYVDGIEYEVKKSGSKDITIELFESESNSDASVFDVFFKEQLKYKFGSGRNSKSYTCRNMNKEKGYLVFKVDKNPELNTEISNNTFISIESNDYQIRMAHEAIQLLTNRPSKHMGPLLTLTEDKDRTRGLKKMSKLSSEIEWKILTSESRKGTARQRKFVETALATPDIAILEGPPGSGKTTAILEVIHQAVEQNKKVMLVASTHVAVDNVLERLLSDKDFKKKFNPVRIGDEQNVYVEDVKQFCQNNIRAKIKNNGYWEIVSDSFNIVCGTTLGILQYDKIKKMFNQGNTTTLIEPLFDYMILDEASKTTYFEFIIPALFAKKWLIIGDTMQLSPFIEEDNITPNLISCRALKSKENRVAINFLVNKRYKFRNNISNCAFFMPENAIRYILDSQKSSSNREDYIVLSDSVYEGYTCISGNDLDSANYKCAALYNSTYPILISDKKSIVNFAYNYFGNNYTFYHLGNKYIYDKDYKWINDNVLKNYQYKKLTLTPENMKKISNNAEILNKNIEDEIVWRLCRIYELANNNDKSKIETYEKYIDLVRESILDNDLDDFNITLSTIEHIAIPSVITLLQKGLPNINKAKIKNESILSTGFESMPEYKNRIVTLDYQYRMHPDISKFPRSFVYDDKALKDDPKDNSYFTYGPKPNNRALFVNVKNGKAIRNENKEEIKKIIEEIQIIENFAKKYDKKITVAILSFYKKQVDSVRNVLQKRYKTSNKFNFKKENLHITINNVDKFQGQEADIVLLTLTQTERAGFMDSICRVNVAVTRAREKLIVFGNKSFYLGSKNTSDILKKLVTEMEEM